MNIVLGVAGGIAAYKACHVVRLLKEHGHSVRVVPTEAALKFVGAPTWEALSGQPVATDVFDRVEEVQHVNVGHGADLVIVAPATADLLARARAGMGNDMLSATLLVATCPVVYVPAMHTEMWLNPATQDNVETLRVRGAHVMEPASGRLTGADSGPGRLPEPADIVEYALSKAGETPPVGNQALAGTRVLISAGGTREPLDPVRYLGNRSSGKQGVALAQVALNMGAHVTVCAANIASDVLEPIRGRATIEPVETTAELHEQCVAHGEKSDLIIMAAAVADYRPSEVAEHKMKKSGDDGMTLSLVQNPDILKDLVARFGDTKTIVGFAAETGTADDTPETLAQQKLLRKGCRALVFNSVAQGAVFGDDTTSVIVYERDGSQVRELVRASGSKQEVSRVVMESVAQLLPS
ncbi:bifunctional phosphopantothenoylcysteine decarboxylase/phosphopantothenate--cysteine ligase CoaBC [Brevibacterium paucivorans]|uniref:Coenzyme A biosynthesis bifunctional protein CoaBC n=1 Tax=Brevibacterium paucivorans TaxID=170994 RepID=A0A2N6VQL9_9MICO|nr:bifunctional phosphopantothenoylcysteine decarboxylase/phosphopantothenate--cysteine ligase CoaBC [Brevibacterium paucivorans]PMD06430.1 bifunctional phosphopantothenoylcysteine decarboxylase/phosphopantothenate--cysteine ligase CoaBC [Brevibacterium paucivorans]